MANSSHPADKKPPLFKINTQTRGSRTLHNGDASWPCGPRGISREAAEEKLPTVANGIPKNHLIIDHTGDKNVAALFQ
jgi:hypothetical protein